MSKHRTPIVLMIAIVAALVWAPSAGARTAHKYSAKAVIATLSTDDGYPGVGGTALLGGSLKSTLGAGAMVDRVKITAFEGNVITFVGGEVDYFARGTQHNMFAGTATIAQDGSQTLRIEGRYTGGTGLYRGASGHYRFVGTSPPGSTIITGHSSGTLTF